MNHKDYTIEQLVLDSYFRQWVYGELPEEDVFWESWMAENPDRTYLVEQAKFIVEALRMNHAAIPEEKVARNVERLLETIEREENTRRNPFLYYAWRVAVMLIVALGIYYYFVPESRNAAVAFENIAENMGLETVEKINNGAKPLTLSLSDGSAITLQPGSSLSYPETFAADKREVVLHGEGFFEIAPDPAKPFVVYANEIVTKVLGTSFHIKAYEDDPEVIVKVVTGKVSVSAPKVLDRSGPAEGLILSPNQMAVYARTPDKLTRTLVENPGILKNSDIRSSDYNFEDTPIVEVFRTLEKGYGVPILFNAEQLANCTVTAPLENENLYEKLDMICKVIRASYEVVDAQIIITSRGCD